MQQLILEQGAAVDKYTLTLNGAESSFKVVADSADTDGKTFLINDANGNKIATVTVKTALMQLQRLTHLYPLVKKSQLQMQKLQKLQARKQHTMIVTETRLLQMPLMTIFLLQQTAQQ